MPASDSELVDYLIRQIEWRVKGTNETVPPIPGGQLPPNTECALGLDFHWRCPQDFREALTEALERERIIDEVIQA